MFYMMKIRKLICMVFFDAPVLGCVADIYLRCPTNSNSSSNLLCSKSRAATLKPLTVSRLELCAAALLSQVISKVVNLLTLHINKAIMWRDSTIVLARIQTLPHLLKTFVANRVWNIQELTQTCQWKHMRSEGNPEDLMYRGLTFDKLTVNFAGTSLPSFGKETWSLIKIMTYNM